MIIITDIPIQFDCFKAYEEDTYYTNGPHVIIFRTLYHFATLIYNEGSEIPQQSVDGNYYKIPDPSKAECGDIFAEKTEVMIEDSVLKIQVEEILKFSDPIELDERFEQLGFKSTSRQMMYGAGTATVSQKITDQSHRIQENIISLNRADMPLWTIS